MWVKTSEQLPPPSAANRNRTDYVLLCDCCRVRGKDATEKIEFSIISAYYNFKTEAWMNDSMADDEIYEDDYWMPLPAENSPQWQHWNVPPAPGTIPGLSIDVLVSIHGVPYERSITDGYYSTNGEYWATTGSCNKQTGDGLIEVTRWHPIAPLPDLPPLPPMPPAEKGFIASLKKLFGK